MNEKDEDGTFKGLSNCCTAPVYRADICSQCYEHCEVIRND